eukprot:gb/GECH01002430.1/.p1 GENE.gb/GECH01002430.1/~~gb/GECH01002430.1/.p1  ORF type:complete len:1206 (+),score=300.84 gb/GECH01002430.1/:1-3618(+)
MSKIKWNTSSQIYPITSEFSQLCIETELDLSSLCVNDEIRKELQKEPQKQLLFVVDTSGSMYGSILNAAKAIKRMLESLNSLFTDIKLVCFNDKVFVHQLLFSSSSPSTTTTSTTTFQYNTEMGGKKSLEEAYQLIDRKCIADGGTSFVNVLHAISKIVKKTPECDTTEIVFLTDGEDRASVSERKEALETLQSHLRKRMFSRIHSIGFTKYHDARLLTQLTQSGIFEGSFQYIIIPSILPQVGDIIIELIRNESSESVVAAQLSIPNTDSIPELFSLPFVSNTNERFISISIPMVPNESSDFHNNRKTFHGKVFIPSDMIHFQSNNSETFEHRLQVEYQTSLSPLVEKYLGSQDRSHLNSEGKLKMLIEINPTIESERVSINVLLDFTRHIIKEMIRKVVIISESKEKDQDQKNQLLSQIKLRAEEIESVLNEKVHNIMKLPKHQRRALHEMIPQIKELIHSFYEILAKSRANNLTNHNLASLNNEAYKKLSKRSTSKKLLKRMDKNAEWFDRNETEINNYVQHLDFKNLREKYQNLLDQDKDVNIGRCILSFSDWLEAIEDGDCLGIAIDLSRSSGAVMDPNQLKIRAVHHSIISVETFFDALRFTLPSNPEASGGFNRTAHGEIIVGQAREPITGVLPLYICEDHWRVAQKRLKPLFGWMTTLEDLGYSVWQKQTIPFLVLCKAAESRNVWTKNKIRFEWILSTCEQVFRESESMRTPIQSEISSNSTEQNNIKNNNQTDRSNNKLRMLPSNCPLISSKLKLMNEMIPYLFNYYVSEPILRPANIIPGNRAFLGQVISAIHLNTIKKSDLSLDYINDFFNCLMEEEIRRWMSKSYQSQSHSDIAQLCSEISYLGGMETIHNNKQKMVAEFKDKLSSQFRGSQGSEENSDEAKRIQSVLNKNEKKTYPKIESSKQFKLNETKSQNSSLIETLQEVLLKHRENNFDGKVQNENIKRFPIIQEVLDIIDLIASELLSIKEWILEEMGATEQSEKLRRDLNHSSISPQMMGIHNDTQLVAMAIQNALQTKNSIRVQTIRENRYWNLFGDKTNVAPKFILEMVVDYIGKENERALDCALRQIKREHAIILGTRFAQTPNMKEAAGILYGMKYGDPFLFHGIIIAMQTKNVQHVYSKLNMMITGRYCEILLFQDNRKDFDKGVNRLWNPSKQNSFRIWLNNRNQLNVTQWKQLFPKFNSTIEKWNIFF